MVRRALPSGLDVIGEPVPGSADVRLQIAQESMIVRPLLSPTLADARHALQVGPVPSALAMQRLTPGVRGLLEDVGVGWIAADGAVSLHSGSVLIARDAQAGPMRVASRWKNSDIRVAEALIVGVTPTVAAVAAATGLAPSAVGGALGRLQARGLLESQAARGRNSRRFVKDSRQLLSSYVAAADPVAPADFLRVGVLWRDPVVELRRIGAIWTKEGIDWGITGPLAASLLSPALTTTEPWQVSVASDKLSPFLYAVERADLQLDEGGRLLLGPLPKSTSPRLVTSVDGVNVLPWPRVYADLQVSGVRGEDAADELRTQMIDRGLVGE